MTRLSRRSLVSGMTQQTFARLSFSFSLRFLFVRVAFSFRSASSCSASSSALRRPSMSSSASVGWSNAPFSSPDEATSSSGTKSSSKSSPRCTLIFGASRTEVAMGMSRPSTSETARGT
ncbi:hypothetical protein BS17DRAFT_415735 [Gyrodon lividus]|nr:hypothetical protein BS17DRAFT_415735 [Gyrodon lividus]